jgi:hypothetical protein
MEEGLDGESHAPTILAPRKGPGIHYTVGWMCSWTVAEKLSPPGTLSSDQPARSELLYRLSYPGLQSYCNDYKYLKYRLGNSLY